MGNIFIYLTCTLTICETLFLIIKIEYFRLANMYNKNSQQFHKVNMVFTTRFTKCPDLLPKPLKLILKLSLVILVVISMRNGDLGRRSVIFRMFSRFNRSQLRDNHLLDWFGHEFGLFSRSDYPFLQSLVTLESGISTAIPQPCLRYHPRVWHRLSPFPP